MFFDLLTLQNPSPVRVDRARTPSSPVVLRHLQVSASSCSRSSSKRRLRGVQSRRASCAAGSLGRSRLLGEWRTDLHQHTRKRTNKVSDRLKWRLVEVAGGDLVVRVLVYRSVLHFHSLPHLGEGMRSKYVLDISFNILPKSSFIHSFAFKVILGSLLETGLINTVESTKSSSCS